MEPFPDHINYLKHLAKEFPSRETVAEAIINLQAQLKLPKGTEHFISDIHGEYEAFCKVVSHASGAIKRKIAEIFKDTLADEEKIKLATHQGKTASDTDDLEAHDIDCTTEILESSNQRIRIEQTDQGREIMCRIEEMKALHDAYRKGLLT